MSRRRHTLKLGVSRSGALLSKRSVTRQLLCGGPSRADAHRGLPPRQEAKGQGEMAHHGRWRWALLLRCDAM